MRHWGYLVEHWQDITVYMAVGRNALSWPDLLKLALPFIVALATSVIVTQVKLSAVEEDVRDIKLEVSTGILPVAKEQNREIREDIVELKHEHDLVLQVIASLQENSPGKCLKCHMLQSINHPSRQSDQR